LDADALAALRAVPDTRDLMRRRLDADRLAMCPGRSRTARDNNTGSSGGTGDGEVVVDLKVWAAAAAHPDRTRRAAP